MADGSITFSTALDNKQLEKDLRKATNDVEGLKRRIEKGGDDRTYIASKLKAAMKAAQDARAEVERLQQSMGVEGGSKELAQHIREAAKEAEKLARPLEEKRAQRTALEEELDNAIAKEAEAIAKIEELEAKRAELRAQGDIRGAGDVRMEESPYRIQLNEQDAKIEELRARWEAVSAEVEEYEGKIAEANAAVAEMETLQAAEASLKQREGEAASLERKWDATDEKVKEYERDLERAKSRASELAAEADKQVPIWQRAAEAIRTRFASIAESIHNHMANAASRSVAPWEQFTKRVGGLMRRVFVFSVILKCLNAVKNQIGSMLMQNSTFAASVENLKAVFNGFASSLVSAVMPTLIALMNTIAAAFTKIAGLIDAIFGTKIVAAINAQRAAAMAAAGATEKQAGAAKNLAKEQKEANRQIMAFDEINAMSDSASGDSSGSGGGGGGDAGGAGGLGDLGGGLFKGILDWLDKIKDRILNDVDGPFARIREGLQRIAKGWKEVLDGFRTGDLGLIWKGITDIIVGACYVIEGAFDALMDWLDEVTGGRFHNFFAGLETIVHGFVEIIEGILTGDLAMVVDGVVDVLDGVRLTIIGIVDAIELAWSALMDWLDEQTGGRFHDIFEGLKMIVSGAADFIRGILTADMPLMLSGVMEMIDGIALTVDGVIDAICDAVAYGVGWVFDQLSESIPSLSGFLQSTKSLFLGAIEGVRTALKSAVDGACLVVKGALDLVVGLSTHNAELIKQGIEELARGVETIVDGLSGGLRGVIGSLFDWIRDGIRGAYDYLASKFPEAEGLFAGLRDFLLGILGVIEGAITGVVDGVTIMVDGALDGLTQIVQGAVDIVVGIFTGSGERICEGLRGVFNGFISIIEGLLDGALYGIVDFANGVISGLSLLPGVSIPSISFSSVRLPRLAQGAVIPPNREFMAILGDQTSGTNIETPESLLRQVLREEIGPMLGEAILALSSQGDGGDVNLVLMVDGEELSRAVSRGNASRVRRGDLVPNIELQLGL